jgi:hypothetical protein
MENIFNLLQPENKTVLNNINGNNADIVNTLLAAVPKALQQGKSIYAPFVESDILKTCAKVWHFVKYKIFYETDIPGTQQIQLPSALLKSKRGDCKSKTLLTIAILKNALPSCKIFIRFVSYDRNDQTPTHVYCYVVTPGGKTILVDSVYFAFDKEKNYFYKKDFEIMEISTISGFENATYSDIGKFKKKTKAERKERRKNFVKKAKTVALAAPRGAFLSLVAINARGMASKLAKAPKEKVVKIWKALGGDPDKLYKTIANGAKRKAFLGSNIKDVKGLENIGVVDIAAITALLASAAPIIAALAPILKLIGSNKDKKEIEDLEKETTDAGGKLDIPNGEVGDPEPGSGKTAPRGGGGGGGLDMLKDNLPLIAGAGIALYLITKKKN